MGCCEATNPDLTCDRRTALKAMVGVGGALALGACRPRRAGDTATLRLAFCGQLLCVVPYEVARARGHFAAQGLSVELVYTRGGNAAMQALVGGAVEYAGTSFDVALPGGRQRRLDPPIRLDRPAAALRPRLLIRPP